MIRHLALMSAATLLIVTCMLLPFLPGPYDVLAVPLSFMFQIFSMAGLLLVPIGIAWLVYEFRNRAGKAGIPPGKDMGYWFALASIGVSTMLVLLFSLGVGLAVSVSLGIGMIAFWVYVVWQLAAKLKVMSNVEVRTFNPVPLYLVVLPIVAAISKFALVGPAAEFSRNRAIENSATLINDIERYRDANGHYPRSLLAVWKDYDPGVIGVQQYHYEPAGEAYNLYFEHFSVHLDTREIVMYNRRDEHFMPSHDSDILLWTPEQLARRGNYPVHNASKPHWKYFLFD